ncbi:response regulator transcription factor [Evansella sp. LMS18]|jgi:DNA-binding response OmpR family regulator|uniref:response regulator transcription factor n=1 Tax=Evansella sp. LMS18 TaxID=2924033 RepID=UPI0020D1ABA5|nr:response regulator transcription factor [Evansella sp. LMS18]UTR12834.1 response regulator transcription factor [Evansella sp. LMS18]
MGSARILIVEDEENIARVVKLELEYEGYETDILEDGLAAWQALQEKSWDLILLDVMMPKLSGIEVLRRMRAAGNETPVIMLTARDAVVDKVTGLDQGANDYVTKPFEIEELLARIRASLRFSITRKAVDAEDDNKAAFLDLSVDTKTREVTRGETSIELTPREYDLLLYLLDHPNQVLTREQLLNHVWGFDYYGDTNVVDVYIRYLRQKVDKPFSTPLIHTVRGVGYVLKEQM